MTLAFIVDLLEPVNILVSLLTALGYFALCAGILSTATADSYACSRKAEYIFYVIFKSFGTIFSHTCLLKSLGIPLKNYISNMLASSFVIFFKLVILGTAPGMAYYLLFDAI